MPQLVYAYNATKHASTGYCPYFLLYGRDPKLLVDQFLGLGEDGESKTVDEWVTEHYLQMEEAVNKARENLQAVALTRQERLNKKAMATDIPIGARVLVWSRVLGHNKIQDFWKRQPYQVVG